MKKLVLLFFISFNLAFAQSDDYNFRNAHQNMVIGNYQTAISYYDQYLNQNPNSSLGYQERGVCYMNLGEFQKANENFSRAIIIMPMNWDYYINRGFSYMFLGLPKNAVDDFTHAINYGAAQSSSAFIGRSNAYIDLGNYGQALSDINSALSLSPNDGRALIVRAEIYGLLNDTMHLFQDLSTIADKYPDAIYADVRIYTLTLIYDNANADILFLEGLISNEPNNFFLLIKQGFDYYILKKFNEALDRFRRAANYYNDISPIPNDALNKLILNCENFLNR